LKQAIKDDNAFCLRLETNAPLAGGVVISPDTNEIEWLAVSGAHRGRGLGAALLEKALARLNPEKNIVVQTLTTRYPKGAPHGPSTPASGLSSGKTAETTRRVCPRSSWNRLGYLGAEGLRRAPAGLVPEGSKGGMDGP